MWPSRVSLAWDSVRSDLSQYHTRTFLRYPKQGLPHPKEAGAWPSLGIPRGQIADYRFPPGHDCRGVHVQEFEEYWEVHVDAVHPACDLIDHLRTDAPAAWFTTGTVIGGVVGALLTRSKEGFLVGAVIGAVLSKASGSTEDGRAPQGHE